MNACRDSCGGSPAAQVLIRSRGPLLAEVIMQFARPILSVGFLLALWGTLRGQGGSPDSATVRAAVATLHSDLRNFVVAQEAYCADHVTYRHSYGFRHQSQ